MITPADRSQFQALAIQQGKYQPALVHQEVMGWITRQFGVYALDFFCETRSATKGKQQLVHVILNTMEDVKRMQANRADQATIAERFLQYFKSASAQADPLKRTDLDFKTGPLPEIVVTYRPFKYPDSKIVNEMFEEEKFAALKAFESVWTSSQYVIFYYTDAQIKAHQADGTSAKITEALNQVYLKYGFEPPSYRFDSKEIFDRDYEGNWYYYWK